MKRIYWIAFTIALSAFAQGDRGTITGTVTDSSAAAVANAKIEVKNVDTGELYSTASTETGNYTLAQLPAANYELRVSSAGFTEYVQQGIRVQVAQVERINVVVQIGSSTQAVTVTADAPLLRTENAAVTEDITGSQINALPLYGAQGANAGPRWAMSFAQTEPGTTLVASSNGLDTATRVNGLPNSSFQVRVEGMEATWIENPGSVLAALPGVDSLEEVALQTSNFSAEYGQVSGGMFNFTTKSGTNSLHGSGFEFFRNEFMNASQPFTNVRPYNRSQDFGGSVGGPVYLPHLYNGRNRTFFFFNDERYYQNLTVSGIYGTVPTTLMRAGNFSQILTGRQLATDPLGNPIMENTIYDPATASTVNGQIVTTPFAGNVIPQSRINPISTAIQSYVPLPTNSALVNNYAEVQPSNQRDNVLSVKVDHNLNDKTKMSFYFAYKTRGSDINVSMPTPITEARRLALRDPTTRFNFDRTITPTFLVHFGFGFMRTFECDCAPNAVLQFDAPGKLGLTGGLVTNFTGVPATGFPEVLSLVGGNGAGYNDNNGAGMGPHNANHYIEDKPTVVLSTSYVHGNHYFKLGGEWRRDAWTNRGISASGTGVTDSSAGTYTFSNIETALPSTNGQNLSGGVVGFPWASFLLGGPDSASMSNPFDPQLRKVSWALYVQDTWKVNSKLTLDYGLRWDYMNAPSELYNRLASFAPSEPNPNAGGLLGAIAYAGTGPGRIGGEFQHPYPYSIGPRLGIAYQITPKWVLRGGWGLTYGMPAAFGYMLNSFGLGYNEIIWNSPTYGTAPVVFGQGLPYTLAQLYANTTDPGMRAVPGMIGTPVGWLDPKGARAPRISQQSIGLQREITTNLVVDVGYVGNRAAWIEANALNSINALTPQRIASFGLNINNAADRTLLTSTVNSALAISRGFGAGPYPGFPLGSTVAQALRPFPQFANISSLWSPRGRTWYDSMQVKVTKRASHGLVGTAAFTYEDELATPGAGGGSFANDVYNMPVNKGLSASSVPLAFVTSLTYTTPKIGSGRWMRAAIRDWAIGGLFRYQSGLPIQSPTSNNALSSLTFQSTFADRVPGQPLFNVNIDCHCFDPNKTFVLNPAAWVDPPAGQWGTAAPFYNNYRYQRIPSENLSLARQFPIREGMYVEFRAIFFNPFNRTYMSLPSVSNAKATQTVSASGQALSGFGWINTGVELYSHWPRNGTLQAKFVF